MGPRKPDTTPAQPSYSHPDPVTDEALDWFVRLQDEPVEESMRTAYEAWVRAHPSHAEAMTKLERMYAAPSMRRATTHAAERFGLAPSDQQTPAKPSRTKRRRALRASLATGALLLILGLQQSPSMLIRWRADYTTVAGQIQRLQLPDGSSMTLNTASAVAIDFSNGRRKVDLLQGEAFFDVQHDPAHPFVVTARFGATEVKGTAFAVRTEDAEDAVVLERGRVDVSRVTDRQDKVGLDPGQMVIATANALSPVQSANLDQSLSWLDGRVVFRDRPFASALAELRRYYSGTVIVARRDLNTVAINGNYRVDDVEAAITTLTESAGGSITRLPGGILILR